MAFRVASHLKRNRFGIYYFRRVVPRDLQGCFQSREVSRSMRTSCRREAIVLGRRFAASLDDLFLRLRALAKKNPDSLQTNLIVMFDFANDGSLKSLSVDAKEGEETLAKEILPEAVRIARELGPRGSAQPKASGGASLSSEIRMYLEEHSRDGIWSAQTAQDLRGDFEQFLSILGDVPVASLRHESLNTLRDTLFRLPANMNKLPQTRGKTIAQVLELGLPPQSASNVRKKWTRLISFFDWLVGKGLIGANYARGKKPKAKARSYEKLSREDLVRLFESAEYRQGSFREAFQYWLPLLGLFTGVRLEELAQLHLADIRFNAASGGWIIDITEETDPWGWDGGPEEVEERVVAQDMPCTRSPGRRGS